MRTCGVCKKPPRYDDSLQRIQASAADTGPGQDFLVSALGVFEGSVGVLACRGCIAQWLGLPASEDPTYPPGCQMPPRPGGKEDTLLDICGLCRRALREDDQPRSIRLLHEDLIDPLWEAYRAALEPARHALKAAMEPAYCVYNLDGAPAQMKRDTLWNKAQTELDAAIERAVLNATTQEEASRMTAELVDHHQQRMAIVEAEYNAVVAAPRLVLEQALAKAAFPYRQAAIRAYRELTPQYATHSPSAEPGRYLACCDCLEKYQPRVAERLKRTGLVKPDVPNESVQGDWLM